MLTHVAEAHARNVESLFLLTDSRHTVWSVLWSLAVATGGDRWQMKRSEERLKQAKPSPWVATACRSNAMVRGAPKKGRGSPLWLRKKRQVLRTRRPTGLGRHEPVTRPAGRQAGHARLPRASAAPLDQRKQFPLRGPHMGVDRLTKQRSACDSLNLEPVLGLQLSRAEWVPIGRSRSLTNAFTSSSGEPQVKSPSSSTT
jgi:hypothetical protein